MSLRTSFVVIGVVALAVSSVANPGKPQPPTTRKIHLLHANTLSFDKRQDAERKVLRGDVRLRQDSCYFYCDSAYLWESTNSVRAFSHVRMEQGDSLFMYCDSLDYDGDRMYGQLYDHVHVIHKSPKSGNDTHLYTDYLTYDRQLAEAQYPETGVMIDSMVHLRSQVGWYYPQLHQAFFEYDVEGRCYDKSDTTLRRMGMPSHNYYPDDKKLVPLYWLYSDSLRYDFDTRVASVEGPSRIVNDTATIYTTLGSFNTESQQALLFNHSSIVSPGRYATGDTLFYDAFIGEGEAWGNFLAVDSLEHMMVSGDYAYYLGNDSTPQRGYVTGRALAKEYANGDTLYLHGDTLRAFTRVVMDTIPADTLLGRPERIRPDTLRYMQAYHNVRYYRSDIQGVCDSLIYSVRDSLATFVGNPVMWNGTYQITGDTIYATVTNKGIKRARIHPNAFLTQSHDESLNYDIDTLSQVQRNALRIDTIHYDQISGRELICQFDSGRVRQMDMNGNVTIIYFPEESDHSMIGLNQMIGNYLTVWFKDQRMERLRLWPEVVGSLTPIQLVTPNILYLNGFRWMAYLRPKSPMDVYREIVMKEEDKQEAVQLFDYRELNGW